MPTLSVRQTSSVPESPAVPWRDQPAMWWLVKHLDPFCFGRNDSSLPGWVYFSSLENSWSVNLVHPNIHKVCLWIITLFSKTKTISKKTGAVWCFFAKYFNVMWPLEKSHYTFKKDKNKKGKTINLRITFKTVLIICMVGNCLRASGTPKPHYQKSLQCGLDTA